jgi:hypothetical protein
MNPLPLRITKLTGFGQSDKADFSSSPVRLGTANECEVRFDATLNRGVAPVHCELAWNGEAWFVLDFGSPEGTWAGGVRLTEGTRIEGQMEISLGCSGPRLKVEVLPAPVPVPLPAPTTTPAHPVVAVSPQRKTTTMMMASLIAIIILLAGTLVFQSVFRPKEERGMQFPPPGGDGTALIADGPGGGPVYVPPNVNPPSMATYQAGDPHNPEHLVTWLPNTPSFQSSPYISGAPLKPNTSAFLGISSEGSLDPDAELAMLQSGIYWFGMEKEKKESILDMVLDALGFSSSKHRAFKASTAAYVVPGGDQKKLQADFQARAAKALRAEAPAAPKLWSVFVGIDDYQHINDISGCKSDAAGLAMIFMKHGMADPERTAILTEKRTGEMKATGVNIQKALAHALAQAGPQDMVIFTFSGHGGYDEEAQDTVFAGTDFRFEAAAETGLCGRQLQQMVSQSRASKILMVFDACHAGGLAAIGRSPRNFRNGLDTDFLDALARSTGHVVIRASGKDEFTVGEPKLDHGLFTFVFLSGLTGAADRDGDGIVTLSELRPYVSRETPALAAKLGYAPFHPSFTSAGQMGEMGDIPLTIVPKLSNP